MTNSTNTFLDGTENFTIYPQEAVLKTCLTISSSDYTDSHAIHFAGLGSIRKMRDRLTEMLANLPAAEEPGVEAPPYPIEVPF